MVWTRPGEWLLAVTLLQLRGAHGCGLADEVDRLAPDRRFRMCVAPNGSGSRRWGRLHRGDRRAVRREGTAGASVAR